MCRAENKLILSWSRATVSAIAAALLTLQPFSPASAQDQRIMAQIEQLYQQQRFEEVVNLLGESARSGLDHSQAWLRFGNSLDQLGRLDEAVVAYRQAASMPLPQAQRSGYLEARRIQGKALLNLARVNLSLARSALQAFQENGMPDASQLAIVQTELEIGRDLESKVSPPQPVRRAAAVTPSTASAESITSRLSKASKPAVSSAISTATDPSVVIEYLRGSPQAGPR